MHHTHLYPGARGQFIGPAGDGPARVEFSDGTVVLGQLGPGCLIVPAYRTAAGTAIAAKRWQLAGDCKGVRVVRQITG